MSDEASKTSKISGLTPTPTMGMGFKSKPKTLGRQLTEFAAKRATRNIVDAVSRHAEDKLLGKLNSSTHRKPRNSYTRNKTMFEKSSNRATRRAASSNRQSREDQEPVDVWVNTVLIMDGEQEPVRIGTGRPLSTMKADKPVDTDNDEFNASNAISNAIIANLHRKAEDLGDGESFLIQKGDKAPKAGTITIQVYRTDDNSDAKAAIKEDAEAKAADVLGAMFG